MRPKCLSDRDSFIIPGCGELFCESSAGLGISGVTDLILMGDHHSVSFPNSFFGLSGYDLRNALVALAVVIRADIEEVMVLLSYQRITSSSVIFPLVWMFVLFFSFDQGRQKPAPR